MKISDFSKLVCVNCILAEIIIFKCYQPRTGETEIRISGYRRRALVNIGVTENTAANRLQLAHQNRGALFSLHN
jgi:hypothetical protein